MSKQVTLAAAEAVVAAARKHAEKIGVPSCIAVVDSGANLVAFVRMDRAWLGSIDIAQDKAFTSRAFDMTTKELARMSQPGEPLFGITASNEGRVVIFAGGVPLKVDGVVIGAVGASGGGPTRITKSPRPAPPRSHPEARPSAEQDEQAFAPTLCHSRAPRYCSIRCDPIPGDSSSLFDSRGDLQPWQFNFGTPCVRWSACATR